MPSESRTLNWAGHSIETIAAWYESDMAALERSQGLIHEDYIWSAWRAEVKEMGLDGNAT
jgi:hypothetical protein